MGRHVALKVRDKIPYLGAVAVRPGLELLFLQHPVLSGGLLDEIEELSLGNGHILKVRILSEMEFFLSLRIRCHSQHAVLHHP